MEKIHWGVPSCHLINKHTTYMSNTGWKIMSDRISVCVYLCVCVCRDHCCIPLVSPARNCRAWRTKSDQHGTEENHTLRELAGEHCHIWTFSSNCASTTSALWYAVRTEIIICIIFTWESAMSAYQRRACKVLCPQDALQQAEEADGYFLHWNRAARTLLHNSSKIMRRLSKYMYILCTCTHTIL